MIDEEGKTVTRLIKIIKHEVSQKLFGDLYKSNPKVGEKVYINYINNLCKYLKNIGININTVPVLDILRKNTSKIIGVRSFSNEPKIVKKLGTICINQYHLNKVATVIKHVPGHGCALVDSHLKLPRVKLSRKNLYKNDFVPFNSSLSKFAMTAHVLYQNIDRSNVATFSKKIISNIIRKKNEI